jgi:hypothetical protein
MTQPVVAYFNVNTGASRQQSTYVTATFDNRSSFGAQLNVIVHHTSDGVSAGAELWGQRSVDGGNSYDDSDEKQLLHVFNSVGNVGADKERSVEIPRGYWLLALQVAGPHTASARFATAEVVTAYE